MFKWIKTHGCNCHPVPDGCERYWLNVGDLYQGTVESKKLEWETGVSWSAEVFVASQVHCLTGMSGGGMTRDEGMEFVEQRIWDCLKALKAALDDPHREIYDALSKRNEKGEFEQERLK
jgi:hypothetical protein